MTSEVISFQLILHAGNAKSFAMEAMSAAGEYNFEKASERIKQAEEEIAIAHKSQYDLLSDYSNGKDVPLDILMVHAQDHISGAQLVIEMAKEIIKLNQNIYLMK